MMKKQVLKLITSTLAMMLLFGISSYGQSSFPYQQNFSDFVFDSGTEVTSFGNQNEWTFNATGSHATRLQYMGDWGTGTSTGFRGNDLVMGYQHSGTSGVFTAMLTITNNTGETITLVNISYTGRVERITEGRSPEWTVEVDGQVVPDLFYSTTGNTDQEKSAAVAVNVPDGQDLVIVWSSDRGGPGGASKQIGIANVQVNTGEATQVAAPVFSPPGGTYFEDQHVEITTVTENADIFYSTTSADGPWADYISEILVSETTTIWAYATADGMDDSNVAHATFTFPAVTEVATLAALRDMPADGTIYRYVGDAVIVAMDSFRNRKFIQDGTAAILIDDQPGTISTPYDLYDVITDVIGQLNIFNDMLRFQPMVNTEPATQNTPVEPAVFEIGAVTPDDQAKLIKFESVTFIDIDGGQTFSNGTNYVITDGVEEFVVRTDFWNVDYIGEEIPLTAISLAGVVLQYQETLQLVPRFAADFDDAGEPDPDPYVVSISATPDILAQSLTIQGSVFGDVEEVSIGTLISVDENDYPDDFMGHQPFMLEVSDGTFAITLVEGESWPGGDSWHGLIGGVHQVRAAILDDQGGIADFKDSNEFTVTEIMEVPTLSELREMPADGTLYKYTGNAVIVAMDGFRNRKFIQDETAAILIDDNPGVISTEYELYDVITNVIGKTNIHLNMVQFQPEANTEPSTENTPVDPYLFSLDQVTSDDQAKLVQFENVTFVDIEEGQNFANGTNYIITDGVNEFVLRTDFWNVDFIGEEIPQTQQNISGVILQHIDNLQLVPRFAADFEDAEVEDPSFTVTFIVVDADGIEIDHAIIALGDIVNEAGDYVFEEVLEGSYNYNVSAICHTDLSGEIFVNEDMQVTVELALQILAGDANGDGVVNVLDIILIANYYAGIIPSNFCFHNADVNNDGAINILDVIATVNIYASGK